VLCRIFGPKADAVTREWRGLHKEELYDPWYLDGQIAKNEMGKQ